MSLSVARSKLMTSLKDLNTRWEKVRLHWDDPVARDFQSQFLAPLDGKVRSCASAIERMYEMVTKARRDCE